MSDPSLERCGTCRYAFHAPGMDLQTRECRRYPPTLHTIARPGRIHGQVDFAFHGVFVPVSVHVGCGEWSARLPSHAINDPALGDVA